MKQEQQQNSLLMAIFFAVVIAMILGVFGKSVQAAGLLKPKNVDQSNISIKSHDVRVVINNGFAKTEVDQIFINTGDKNLEAVYSFPLPKEASLSELSLWIDGNEIIGEVLEKQQARQVYEDQKNKGNQTAVAEKEDYKDFNISVSPVLAGNETRVRLVYYQPLNIDLNVGRYVYPLADGGVDEKKIAFWSVDSDVKESFTFDLILKSALPVTDIRLPGYTQHASIETIQSEENEKSGTSHHARLDFTEGTTLTKDVVFYYKLDDSVPARVELVPYKEEGEQQGTFMLTITPGASLERITEGVDWTFVLDKSGSMSDGKLQTLSEGVSQVIGKMSPSDRFRIVTFNNKAEDFTKGYINATPENVQSVLANMKNIYADGGTDLYAGLKLGLRKIDDKRTSTIILVTDGVANLGQTQRTFFMQLIEENDVRLFTFIIGNSSNRPLLEKLAKASGGFAMDVSSQDDIYGRILQAKTKVLYQALHDAEISISGNKVMNLTPEDLGSLYQGQQAVIFGQYEKGGDIDITFSAKISGEQKEWSTKATLPSSATDNPELERLWALSKIDEHMEEIRDGGKESAMKKKIIALGEEYSLVTDYTSMIVLTEQEMENLGINRSNQSRAQKERKAQQQKANQAPAKHRIDNNKNGGMFKNAPSPGIGSGPVGPLFILLLAGCRWIGRRKNN